MMVELKVMDLIQKASHGAVASLSMTTVYVAIFLGGVILLLLLLKDGGRKYKLPPGPSGLPILGYLPFLGPEPWKDFVRLRKIYGNVFSLYMGRTLVVILGDFEAVKEAFSKSTTTDRPPGLFDALPDSVGFSAVNGREWVEQRKFCVKSMKELGIGGSKWEAIIQTEVDDFIKLVSSHDGRAFDVSHLLTSSVSNNISSFVFGRRLPFGHPDREFLDKEMDRIMLSFSQSGVYNFFPVLRDISVRLGIGAAAREHEGMVKFNSFFRREAQKFKQSYKSGEYDNFIVDYLLQMDNQNEKSGHYFNETNLYGNIQALFLGGSDTTRNSLNWLIAIMARFPDVQLKIQQEIDSVLSKGEQIQWPERMKLPYTFATIMEAQRWKTIAPLNTARAASEDIQIQGYDIPKGTTIIANNWGLHRDPKYWKEPEKFDPERFLTSNGKQVIPKPDSYVPFSYGKRGCPGEIIAMMEILMYFSALMQNFTISTPNGRKTILEGQVGLTYNVYPQEFHFSPRNN